MSAAPGSGGETGPDGAAHNIATAIAEVSERANTLVREEIELARAELEQKFSKLARGAVVGVAAGIFFLAALYFVLVGLAWLLYYYLPIGSEFTYFWGFFAMALILVVLGVIAGLIAVRAVKRGAPPVPDMAIEEARLIRETVTAGATPSDASPTASGAAPVASAAVGAAPAPHDIAATGSAPYGAAAPAEGIAGAEDPEEKD